MVVGQQRETGGGRKRKSFKDTPPAVYFFDLRPYILKFPRDGN